MIDVTLGVIGGSGLYEMPGLTDITCVDVDTPFGAPSDALVVGMLRGTRTAFVPRHGRGHRFTPSEVNYRANIWALRSLGCQFVASISAVGSLKQEIAPGHMVVVDQFIDRTVSRARTFFGDGIVAHVPFGDPVCTTLRPLLQNAVTQTGAIVHDGGAYVCIEGPTFSTKAESELFRSWGASVVGMTNLPEARLAREAGMSYCTLALATDYDCWHASEDAVSVQAVVEVIAKNVGVARATVSNLAAQLAAPAAPRVSPWRDVLRGAVMTAPDSITAQARARVALLLRD